MDKEQDGLVERRLETCRSVLRSTGTPADEVDERAKAMAATLWPADRIQQLEAQLSTAREDALREAAKVVKARAVEWRACVEKGMGRVQVSKKWAEGAMVEAEVAVLNILALIQTPDTGASHD